MEGYKTFTIAMVMVAGTFTLILKGIVPPDGWWQVCTAAAAMVSVREAGDKELFKGIFNKSASTLTDTKPGN